MADPIRRSLAPYAAHIQAAFIYGSVAKGTDTAQSDVDLMIIGDDLDYSGLYSATHDAEGVLRRKINPLFLSLGDWQRKIAERGSFVGKVNALSKVFIIGSAKDLE
jgi:predicted nucleotidyltransferase